MGTLLISGNDRIITISDAREHFGGCIPGWRTFAELHNFVWQDVVRHGLLASQLVATGDSMAISLVEAVYRKDKSNV